MRITGLILGIVGGVVAGLLGMIWLRDYYSMKDQLEAAASLSQAVGGDVTAQLQQLVTAAYLLLGSLLLGIVGGILAFMGKGKIAGPLMLLGALLPAIFAPKALVFTALLVIAGVVSFFVKPRRQAPPTLS